MGLRKHSWPRSPSRRISPESLVLASFVIVQVLIVGFVYVKLSAVQQTVAPIIDQLRPLIHSLDASKKNFGVGHALEQEMDPKYLLGIHAIWASVVQELEERVVFINPVTRDMMEGVLDVSTFSEFTFIWKRLLQRQKAGLLPQNVFGEHPVVVDVGAMDGLSGSNSFNFVQMGWRAVLVEPNPRHIEKIRSNHFSHYARGQSIDIVEGVIGPEGAPSHSCKDQTLGQRCVDLCLRRHEASATSSTILGNPGFECDRIEVASHTAAEVGSKYSLPRHFEVLDIDAEGVGDVVLKQFLDAGYRPLYILYETSHGLDDTDERLLADKSYFKIRDVGNDHIWELRTSANELRQKRERM